MERMEALTNYYTTHNEDARLTPKRGMVEFLTTIHYVEKYLKPGMRILEIGAGTGRYSHYFAQNGYAVDAVELMECNIEVFKTNTKDGENITVQQGDAVDLQNIASDQYDITLLLGPMYHLYTDEDKLAAMSEAIRVTKKGGIVFAAYCNNDITVYHFGFLRGGFNTGEHNDLIDFETFKLSSTPKEVFALYRQEDVNELMSHFRTERLHYVGTDIIIDKVMVFPQAYAAVVPQSSLIVNTPRIFIVDIGGYTTDVLLLKNGKLDFQFCRSLESGVITMNNEIIRKVNSYHDMLLEDEHISDVLCGKDIFLPEDVVETIKGATKQHASNILNQLRELQVDLRSNPAIFVGGGSILLRPFLENSPMVMRGSFVDSPNANAVGYEMLGRTQMLRPNA